MLAETPSLRARCVPKDPQPYQFSPLLSHPRNHESRTTRPASAFKSILAPLRGQRDRLQIAGGFLPNRRLQMHQCHCLRERVQTPLEARGGGIHPVLARSRIPAAPGRADEAARSTVQNSILKPLQMFAFIS